MTHTESFMSWFDRALSKVFMKSTETSFLTEEMLKMSDVGLPKLLEMLALLINKLQIYQDNLKESLEESQVDVETIDGEHVDTGMDTSSMRHSSITKENVCDTMLTEPSRTSQDASVQTEDVKISDLSRNSFQTEKSEDTGILQDRETNSSCGLISDESDDVVNKMNDCRHTNDKNLVQIQASKSEIDRRIAAFVEKKQLEVNELNRREFCSVQGPEEEAENSCARVDSLFFTRADGKSHIKVSRVVNLQGPQTQIPTHSVDTSESKEVVQKNNLPLGIEERLTNMEKHLNVSKGKVSCSDVYTRLKFLEERILFLESLSPEYFTFQPPHHKKPRKEKRDNFYRAPEDESMSVSDIDMKIKQLRESLSKKASSSTPASLSNTT
ncbi:MAP3K12-binding inhibitory protein 1-like [Mizuhopecten yessoensis]|uniref:MAP3K12-binding inhibitory protein 1 n=1 Tax=Mizuhopecten yessoensis TaxID=6573 RepID=A0A210PFA1_MIZYE|nr:MAP3K12-binding inhibitory protein 1-like [Mizuhopecten yessoensis]OWF35170.1 MAP3K12-binding inhibitory protein 1 [Mizuhopecten yessoensis]